MVPTLRSEQEAAVKVGETTCKGKDAGESILTRIRAMFRIVRGCRSYRRLGLGLGLGIGEDYGALLSVTGDLTIGASSWIYPYSHDTDGGSVLFRMNNLEIAPHGGIDATARG